MKQLLLILFFIIVSCSSPNKEYNEVVSTNTYKITNRIQIARVHFDFNKFNLTRDFIENSILTDLRTNKNIFKLYIEGHTDNKGKDWYNYRLGLQRALTISNIISTNYPSENIILKSFSYSNSIADNRTENGRSNNRRADIFIDLVEETFEIQTNLIKVDKVNKFNIDLTMLLIILLLILLILLCILIIRYIIGIIIELIKCILNTIKNTKFDTNLTKKLIEISKSKHGKFILKIIYNLICKIFGLFLNLKIFKINVHTKGLIGETLVKIKRLIDDYEIIGKGVEDYKIGGKGLDLMVGKDGKAEVIEIKFGKSELGETKDGKQGSPEYIEARKGAYLSNLDKKSPEYKKYKKLKSTSLLERVDGKNPCKIKSKNL